MAFFRAKYQEVKWVGDNQVEGEHFTERGLEQGGQDRIQRPTTRPLTIWQMSPSRDHFAKLMQCLPIFHFFLYLSTMSQDLARRPTHFVPHRLTLPQ